MIAQRYKIKRKAAIKAREIKGWVGFQNSDGGQGADELRAVKGALNGFWGCADSDGGQGAD